MMYERTFIIDNELFLANGVCEKFSFDGGTGSGSNPYQISNICQIQNISSDTITVGGVLYENLLDKSYKLTENIEASYTAAWNGGAGFYPIGDATDNFTGTFDGDSFTLSTLTIDRTTDNIGGLVGTNTNVIKNSHTSGSVLGNVTVGGFVGLQLGGTIQDTTSDGNVSANDNVGGFLVIMGVEK